MKSMVLIAGCLLATLLAPIPAMAADKPMSEAEKIEALISRLEKLEGAVFIRNGSEYSPKSAGKFLRGKRDAHPDDAKTARMFIDKLASASSTTGQAYLIRFKDGKVVKSGEHLHAELKKLEG